MLANKPQAVSSNGQALRRNRRAAFTGLFLLFAAGCGSSPPTHFYTLDPVSTAQAQNAPDKPVQVAAVHVPAGLEGRQIVEETAPNKLVVSERNQWGAPLAEMTRRVLTQDLAKQLPSATVVMPDQPAPDGTDQIIVSIEQFLEVPSGQVVLEGNWSVVDQGSEKPVLTKPFRFTAPAPAKDYIAQANAMSRTLGQLSGQISAALNASQAATAQ